MIMRHRWGLLRSWNAFLLSPPRAVAADVMLLLLPIPWCSSYTAVFSGAVIAASVLLSALNPLLLHAAANPYNSRLVLPLHNDALANTYAVLLLVPLLLCLWYCFCCFCCPIDALDRCSATISVTPIPVLGTCHVPAQCQSSTKAS
jgi:hypothetical protein